MRLSNPQPRHSVESRAKRAFDGWFVAAAGLVSLLVACVFLTLGKTQRLNDDASWVAHTHEVLRTLQDLDNHMLRAQTAHRLYLILGEDAALVEIADNITSARQDVEKVKNLTDDNQEQQAHIPDLAQQIDRLERLWVDARKTREEQGMDAVAEITAKGESRRVMQDLGSLLGSMGKMERDLLEDRLEQRNETFRTAVVTELLSGVAAVAGVVAFTVLLRRHLSARNAAAAIIAEQRERFRTTLASIGDAVMTTDIDGRVTGLNAVAESLTGWRSEEAAGQPLDRVFNIVNETTRQPVPSPVVRAIREGVVVGLANHTVLLAKDGTERPIDDSAAPIRCAEGQVVGCVLVFRDVTERRRAEQASRDASRHKDEFLATLAHELRNPLAPIASALSILKLVPDDRDACRQAIDTMDRQMTQMVRLIDDLLDVSRISRGKLDLRKQRVELASIVYQAVEICRPLVEGARHELTIDLPKEPAYLDADAVRLAQVFSNLLNNACKFTAAGGHISLTATCRGNEALVSIKDSGIGIPQDQLEFIFGMFSQINGPLDRTHGGLGIGLTLVKKLVELHDGRIEARSEIGKGSEFVVMLPLASSPRVPSPVTSEPALPAASPATETPAASVRRRILVVDDNRDSAESLTILLRLAGNETHTAYDGQEALDLATKVQPDVLLLDIGLPKLNGYDVCRRIREHPWGRNVLMVALTGWGQDDDRRKSREAGFDDHLVKPVQHAALMKVLAQAQPPRV
jgi:PAS domain S-box-containing protein